MLILYCNDRKLLEAKAGDPLGGPEFDGVALTTWNGMDMVAGFPYFFGCPGAVAYPTHH